LTAQFTQNFGEELIPNLLNLFHETKREKTLPHSFYEANVTLIQKLDKDTTNKENCKPISLMNLGAKFLS
jgi:hypothetical protein